MSNVVNFGHEFARQALAVDAQELIVGRYTKWPEWFTNYKFSAGKQFKRGDLLKARDDHNVDFHALNVDGVNVLSIPAVNQIPDILFKMGQEPRLKYLNRWIDLLHDPAYLKKSADYLDYYVNEVEGGYSYFPLFRLLGPDPLETAMFLKNLFATIEQNPRGDVTDANVPQINYTEVIHDFLTDEKLLKVLRWGHSLSERPNRVFDDFARMMMDFWPLVKEHYPDVEGFERDSYYFPEDFVKKHGHPILTVDVNIPPKPLPAPTI